MNNFFDFIANWKMQFTFDEEINFATSNYDKLIQLKQKTKSKIILCPSFLSIYPLSKIFEKTNIEIGAQNCSKHNKGSFTGEISAQSLALTGCNYCIIGHSETRKENHESHHVIAQKFSQLISAKISPILCIGENLKEFKGNKAINSLSEQLKIILEKISTNLKISNYLTIYIAYEPTWAIGTGEIANINHLETIFSWLYKQTQQTNIQINWKLLYGGSVNSTNIKKLKSINYLDGFLLGNASLDFPEFEQIIQQDRL